MFIARFEEGHLVQRRNKMTELNEVITNSKEATLSCLCVALAFVVQHSLTGMLYTVVKVVLTFSRHSPAPLLATYGEN